MKYTILAILCLSLACKKTGNKTTEPTLTSEATSCGLQFEHVYQVGYPNELITGDYIIFHPNQTVTEWAPSYPGSTSNDTFKYMVSLTFSSDNASGLLKNGDAFKACLSMPLDTSNKCIFYSFSEPWPSSTTPYYDTIIFGTFISGSIVQNSQPTLGATSRQTTFSIILTP